MGEAMRKPAWMSKKGVTKRGLAVGLRTRKATTLLVLERRRSPLRGPFTLQAVVSVRTPASVP